MDSDEVTPKTVDLRGAAGVQVGDHNVLHSTFVMRDGAADAIPELEEWPRVRDLDKPVQLGVHPTAHGRQDEPELPPYVQRDTDVELQRALRAASGVGGFVLLVGESTAGKSRSAYEAARRELPGHRLMLLSPGDLAVGLTKLRPGSQVVVWLDDLERYVGPNRLTSPRLQVLRNMHAVVLATMRAEEFAKFSSRLRYSGDPDQYELGLAGSEVIAQADHVVRIERHWSAPERQRASLIQDTRIRDALSRADEYGVCEYLAAGPDLFDEWLNGWAPGKNPRGAALVAAAVDCRRAGMYGPLPVSLLEELHGHYLRARGGARLHPEPFAAALRWAAQQVRATSSLLLPTEDENAYVPFDYLVDVLQRDPDAPSLPEVVWQSVLSRVDDEGRFDVGVAAHDQKQFDIAESIFRALYSGGYSAAGPRLVLALVSEDRFTEAEEFFDSFSDSTELEPEQITLSAMFLGAGYQACDRHDKAEKYYRFAYRLGGEHSGYFLGSLLREQGKLDEAEQIFRPSAELGNAESAYGLAGVLERTGREEEAASWHRRAADGGHVKAMLAMGLMSCQSGDSAGAEEWFRRAIESDDGELSGTVLLAQSLTERREYAQAEPLWRKAAESGNTVAARVLGIVLLELDRPGESENWLTRAAESDDALALEPLGVALHEQSRHEEAERWWRRGAASGDTGCAKRIGLFLANTGRESEAQPFLLAAAEDADVEAMTQLGYLLLDQGRSEGEAWLRKAAETGYPHAAGRLGGHLYALGRTEEAESWLIKAADAGSAPSAHLLGLILAEQQRLEEARYRLQQASELGHPGAADPPASLADTGRGQIELKDLCQSPRIVETFLCSQPLAEAGPVVVFVVDRALEPTHAV
ncbi:tetratricopeptide repeat protein [Streptomyces sp. RLA2-12]|uniref:tetratricopeptide repeat protein n=1 Tax=Streptomyces sp. RLA2-12 TaxID=2721242 RepID=UPI00145F327A|nr:tetratricopeptide repeat protein [Streptomyces sp. RLA2-12]NMI54260.1 tetratricopeptide repeat protein [Streptomyces sp. RLA2-12]